MKFIVAFIACIFIPTAGAAEPLASFKFELSCTRINGAIPTIMIHSVIDFDGSTNTCTATQGHYYEGAAASYEIPFVCEKPQPISTDAGHPLQLWVLKGPLEGPQDRISKLVLVMDHAQRLANGFATGQGGTIHSVTCKKW